MVGMADDAVFFLLLDQFGGAIVADVEVALQEAGAGLAFAGYQGNGLLEQPLFAAAFGEAGQWAGAVIVLDLNSRRRQIKRTRHFEGVRRVGPIGRSCQRLQSRRILKRSE